MRVRKPLTEAQKQAKNEYSRKRYAENPNRYPRKGPEYFRDHYQRNKHKRRAYRLKKDFGITPEQYAEMLLSQEGRCALCNELPKGKKSFAVDHNHTTGKVRALLCGLCNRYIVFAAEKYPQLLDKAKLYLEKHAE